ncbi:RES family NAD+ phosphorylase [Edaphobacter aggregans]
MPDDNNDAAGRWHSKGHPIVYCSEDPSTALLAPGSWR